VQGLRLGVLPTRDFDAQAVLELIAYWQQRNYAADVSHQKRRITQLRQRAKISL
jgi:hypothetical protein